MERKYHEEMNDGLTQKKQICSVFNQENVKENYYWPQVTLTL